VQPLSVPMQRPPVQERPAWRFPVESAIPSRQAGPASVPEPPAVNILLDNLVPHRKAGLPTLWQRSYQLWTESGIEWQHPASRPESEPVLEPLPDDEFDRQLAYAGGVAWQREADGESGHTAEPPEPSFTGFLGAPVQLGDTAQWTKEDDSFLLDAAGRRASYYDAAHHDGADYDAADYDEAGYRTAQPQTHPRMVFGRRVMAMGVPVLVLALVGAMAVALLTGHGPKASQAAWGQPLSSQSLNTASFPAYPGLGQRGVFESMNRVVAAGTTVVATAQQTSAGVAHQQFYVSTDGGTSWHLAPAQSAAGGQPTASSVAPLLAGGPGGWLAIGPHAIWTSQAGTSWTLAATHGVSQVPGDTIDVVTSTAAGFLAGGKTADGQGAVWISPNGTDWQQVTIPDALNVSYATAHDGDIVIIGARAGAGDGAWLSTDGGQAWSPVDIPLSHGGTGKIVGIGWDSAGLLAVRDGSTGDAVTYFSQNGREWQFAGTIGASSGLRPRVVKGNGYGLVVAGQNNTGQLVAYLSTDNGASWRPTAILGNAAAESVGGAAVAPGDSVIAIGATAATTLTQRAVLLEATPDSAKPIPLPGLSLPEVSVSATAQANGQQIAVGSADGYPAIWISSGGDWSLVTRPGEFGSTGLNSLTAITHGPAGWLAVGTNLILTSPDGETWRAIGGTAAPAAAEFLAAAAGPAGYVAVGEQNGPSGSAPVAVWLSPSLATWTTATGIGGTGAGTTGQVRAITADAGGFVAVGSAGGQSAVWVSAGGQAWKLADLSPAGATLSQAAAIGSRIVIAGTNAAGEPLALLSTNGATTWQPVTLPSASPATKIIALTAGPDGFTVTSETSDQQIITWTSADGSAWTG
jgi:hypothetical protein